MKAPIAFEVPGQNPDEIGEGVSIIQAHPPRRLRRLEDEQVNLSAEEVERRHALAEQRRQEVVSPIEYFFLKGLVTKVYCFIIKALQMRVQSARLSTSKGPRRQLLAPITNE